MKAHFLGIALLGLGACRADVVRGEEMEAAQAAVTTIDAESLKAMLDGADAPLLIDVRTPEEYAEGHIEGARLMPLATFDPAALDGENVVLYCRSARRSGEAARMLADHRGAAVRHLEGGINAWKSAGYAVVTP